MTSNNMASKMHGQKDLLNDEELILMLNTSDADISESDEDDPFPPICQNITPMSDLDISTSSDDNSPDFNIAGPSVPVSQPSSRNMKWKTKRMMKTGPDLNEELEADTSEPKGVLEAFFEYFNTDFWQMVADQTNLYSVQNRNLRSVLTSAEELIRFTGIHLLMGTLNLPQAKLYWSRDLDFPMITSTMTRDRFFELRKNLHFVNNLDVPNPNDKLWKIRSFLNPIREKCLLLPRPAHLAIDEQMIPFSGRCQFRQYMPSKPNPLGLKNFVLAARDGLVLDFVIYSGKGTVCEDDMKELGLGASIVKLLTNTVPKDGNHVIYTDRFFTSLKSANYCLDSNIHQTGTVMKNRIGPVSSKLTDDKILKRGEWDEKVREDDKICVVKWKDNKSVTLLSTCVGSEPLANCKRWSKDEKKKVEVPQPAVVRAYNQNMGGIDLCDRFLAYYRCSIRTNKWPVRAFNHFVDLVIVNCWLMYRRSCKRANWPKKKQMPLLSFRLHAANALVKFASCTPVLRSSLRGSPLSLAGDHDEEEEEVVQPTKYRKVVPQPIPEVRFDQNGEINSSNTTTSGSSNANPSEPQLELSFEYLMSKDKLQWVTISSEQAILMSVCLQGMVDELLLKKTGMKRRQPGDGKRKSSWSYMKRDGSSQLISVSQSASCDGISPELNGDIKSPEKTESTSSMKRLSEKLSSVSLKSSSKPAPSSCVENDAFEGIGDEDL